MTGEVELTIELYKKEFQMDPPKHLVRDGKIWCSVCGKEPARLGRILGSSAVIVGEKCQKAQKPANFHPVSINEKMDSMSPEEVMSGVAFGGKNQFGKNSKRGWHEEHKEEVKNFLEAVK